MVCALNIDVAAKDAPTSMTPNQMEYRKSVQAAAARRDSTIFESAVSVLVWVATDSPTPPLNLHHKTLLSIRLQPHWQITYT